jgi:hypothetical protein
VDSFIRTAIFNVSLLCVELNVTIYLYVLLGYVMHDLFVTVCSFCAAAFNIMKLHDHI